MTSFTNQGDHTRKTTILMALTILCTWFLLPGNVMAMAVPAAGSFAYDLYDIGVNQILLGPIGFIAGVACMVFAAILAIRQMILPAAGVVLGGAFLLTVSCFSLFMIKKRLKED